MAAGIPGRALPLTKSGGLTRDKHLAWLKNRRQQEEEAEPNYQNIIVSSNDILMGRGRRSQYHVGNMWLNQKLIENLEEYDASANRREKKKIVLEIFEKVKSNGGRFLKLSKLDCWEVQSEEACIQKIQHDFRTIRKMNIIEENSNSRVKKILPDIQRSKTDGKRARVDD